MLVMLSWSVGALLGVDAMHTQLAGLVDLKLSPIELSLTFIGFCTLSVPSNRTTLQLTPNGSREMDANPEVAT